MEHSICAVVGYRYGKESECTLEIEYNQKSFRVRLIPSTPLQDTIEGTLLSKLDTAQGAAEEDEDEVLEEIADVVCEAGLPQFARLAPPISQRLLPTDLHSLLNPETFHFKLVTVDGRAQLDQQYTQGQETDLSPLATATSLLPSFALKEIQVLERLQGKHITKVLVDGQERCCKISSRLTQAAVQREFNCLTQILAANVESLIRVPKLVGLVYATIDDGNSQVVGIIEEYIHSPVCTSTLRRIDKQNATQLQKVKWADQVRQTVADLHRIEIVWGDGKADNVLLDVNEDVWLIDFGGGWTPGWVDELLAGTIEGDLQAVEKIDCFLGAEKH